ncbi:MAG: hypothetical protein J5847_00565, partial [Clostridia bacterium]|nr:hypothetical protein [Clostridia bacterium]
LGLCLAAGGIRFGEISLSLCLAATGTLLCAFLWGGAYGGVAGLILGLTVGGEWAAILSLTGCAAGFFSLTGAFAAELTSMAVFIGGAIYAFGVGNWVAFLIPITAAEALTAIPASQKLIRRRSPEGEGKEICSETRFGNQKPSIQTVSNDVL